MKAGARYHVTQNACKLCAPLGASLAVRGIKGAVPFLHGSQGCATYIRRYLISHYREPMDIASSSFDESAAVFGGEKNLVAGLNNVAAKYSPELIGIATTCLSETMGEDIEMYLENAKKNFHLPNCNMFSVSTPSYAATHVDGFFRTIYALINSFSAHVSDSEHIAMFPGLVSPADIRYLKEVLSDFELDFDIISDYSDTLDGPTWKEYQAIPQGGTPLSAIKRAGDAAAVVELYRTVSSESRPGALLKAVFGISDYPHTMPIGVVASDKLFATLTKLSKHSIPQKYEDERGRLLDSYVDGHKYVFGKRAAVYGDPDFVIGICAFLAEIGMHPVIAATGTRTGAMKHLLDTLIENKSFAPIIVEETSDFAKLEEDVKQQEVEILIGNSKGYGISKRLGIPLVRVGFPIHDRIGASRILHIGYRGTQQLFDNIVNTLLENRQDSVNIGYAYM